MIRTRILQCATLVCYQPNYHSYTCKIGFLSFILQQSVWAECWKEFKFAVDIRAGDTKPVPSESSSGSSSGSSDSHSESDHYGVINEDSKATGSLSRKKDDSGYAVFNEPNGKKH